MHDIIGPLVAMDMKELCLHPYDRRFVSDALCGKPIICAMDGVAVAPAIIAMASDIRIATPEARTFFSLASVLPVRYGRLRDASAHHRSRAGG